MNGLVEIVSFLSGENESPHVLQNLYGAPVYYTVLSLKRILKIPAGSGVRKTGLLSAFVIVLILIWSFFVLGTSVSPSSSSSTATAKVRNVFCFSCAV
jgi:protein-S-isoprenylcysteine O-methyltransferase Ste14